MQNTVRAYKRESRTTTNASKNRKRKRIKRKSQKFTTANKLAKRKTAREKRKQMRKAVRMNEHYRRLAKAKRAKKRRLRKRRKLLESPQKQRRASMTLVKTRSIESAQRKKEAYLKNKIERKVKKLLSIARRNNQDAGSLVVSLLCKRKRDISHEMYEVMREANIYAFNKTNGEGATKLIALILLRAHIHDFPLSDISTTHRQGEPLRWAT